MAKLFGRDFSRAELCRRFGDLSQIADAREGMLTAGRADQMRVVDVSTGSGLAFTVFPSRGMDIGWASYQGNPISYMSPAGPVKAEFHEPAGAGFMRSFFCGLVTTCGITQMGRPCEDGGESLGQNGRLSHTPAHDVFVRRKWEGDDYLITVGGQMREGCLFRENMLVQRTITTKLGSNSLLLRDHVENQGARTAPLLLMYHINFGYPVLSEHTRLHLSTTTEIRPRDARAEEGLSQIFQYFKPSADFTEQVYYHTIPQTSEQMTACLYNEDMGYGAYIRFDPKRLPYICHWKICGEGEYVTGVEPANAPTAGRAALRESGRLPTLEPGKTADFQVEIGVLTGAEDLERALAGL